MKILVINYKPDLSYYSKRGLNFEVDYKTTNQTFPYFIARPASNLSPAIYTPDVSQYITQFQGYDFIIVAYNPKDYPSLFNYTGGYTHSVPVGKTIWCTIRQDSFTNNYIVHELMHALVYHLNVIKGLNKSNKTMLWDYMDSDKLKRPYYLNNDPENPESNHSQTWEQIKPHLDMLKITTPVATLQRFYDDGVQTLGEFSMGDFKCKTLERPWKDNKPNISCIPIGEYDVEHTWSLKFLKYTYEIKNVKGRSGIRIHSGNFFFDILGCIILGSSYDNLNKDSQVDILNSKNTIDTFEKLLNKKPFKLKITNKN